MKRKINVCVICVSVAICAALILLILCLSGFSKQNGVEKETIGITEVYSLLNNEPTEIEVKIHDPSGVSFMIQESEEIDRIYNIIISQDYHLSNGDLPPGSNIRLKFIFDNSEAIILATRCVEYNGHLYLADNSLELDVFLEEIALKRNLIT